MDESLTSPINTDVSRLLTAARLQSPKFQGTIGSHQSGDIKWGVDNKAAISRLYHQIALAHPEGGQVFWSTRSWITLVRQPVQLALVGVHELNLLPPLEAISQRVVNESICGFTIPNIGIYRPVEHALISSTGACLKHLCDGLFEELSAVTRIRKVNAMRLVADILLATLNRLKLTNKPLSNHQIIKLSSHWLLAMGLAGQSRYTSITLSSGREQLVLNRKGCCMNYRTLKGELCASCPKQKMPKGRIAFNSISTVSEPS